MLQASTKLNGLRHVQRAHEFGAIQVGHGYGQRHHHGECCGPASQAGLGQFASRSDSFAALNLAVRRPAMLQEPTLKRLMAKGCNQPGSAAPAATGRSAAGTVLRLAELEAWKLSFNVRGKRSTAEGRQARAMQDKPQQRAGLVAYRRRSA